MGINIFGMILSIAIVCVLLYAAFIIFFNKKINDYLRIFMVLLILVATVLYVKNDMIYFWS